MKKMVGNNLTHVNDKMQQIKKERIASINKKKDPDESTKAKMLQLQAA
jgi:transcription initiation factor IIE alpha subunit